MAAASKTSQTALDAPKGFIEEGVKFLNKCSKPDAKEYFSILRAVGAGFLVMGAIGFVVKLVHIPIRHYITA